MNSPKLAKEIGSFFIGEAGYNLSVVSVCVVSPFSRPLIGRERRILAGSLRVIVSELVRLSPSQQIRKWQHSASENTIFKELLHLMVSIEKSLLKTSHQSHNYLLEYQESFWLLFVVQNRFFKNNFALKQQASTARFEHNKRHKWNKICLLT